MFLDEPDVTSDQGSLRYLLGLNRPLDPQDAAEAQESIKARVNAIRKKLIQQVLKPADEAVEFLSVESVALCILKGMVHPKCIYI